jgi:hypothetical protein
MTPAMSPDRYRKILLEVFTAVMAVDARATECRLVELARLRSRLAGASNLRAIVRERLIGLIDRIRGVLGLMLVRLRSALSQRSGALRSTLVQLTVGLRCMRRNEPDDDCWLPPRPKQSYGRVRGVAHAVS